MKGVKAVVENLYNRKFRCVVKTLTIPYYQALKQYLLQIFKLQPATLLHKNYGVTSTWRTRAHLPLLQ